MATSNSYDPDSFHRSNQFLIGRLMAVRNVHAVQHHLLNENCVVYVAVSKTTNGMYIGMTAEGIEKRRRRHIKEAMSGRTKTKFANAIRKRGPDDFEFYLWGAFKTVDACRKNERWLIEDFRPEYNLTWGGEGVHGLKFSDASRKRMSEAKRGRPAAWLSGPDAEAIKSKLREAWKNRKPLTPQQVERNRQLQRIAANARKKRVLCETDGKEWPSVGECAAAYGISVATLRNTLVGRSRCRKGLKFSYLEDAQ